MFLASVRCGAGSHDAVNRSEWYSYNPMSSVTTLGTSGSDAASTLGGLDQSSADCVLMASPIRGESLPLLQSMSPFMVTAADGYCYCCCCCYSQWVVSVIFDGYAVMLHVT